MADVGLARRARARCFLLLQRCLPRRALSAAAGWLARREAGWLTTLAIRAFVRAYRVELGEAAAPEATDYASFNAFFTRALAPGARPLPGDPGLVVSPADGCLSALGSLADDCLLQAKGLCYTLDELFDGDRTLAGPFRDGRYATVYLAPRDYHRVHSPATWRPRWLRYIPGELYSVNDATTGALPGLFCRNERVIVVGECWGGLLALIMIGALNVGSIELAWAGAPAPANRPRSAWPAHATLALDVPALARGAEFGRFNLGSTVLVLASPGLLEWLPALAPGDGLRMGEICGRLQRPAAAQPA